MLLSKCQQALENENTISYKLTKEIQNSGEEGIVAANLFTRKVLFS
jgi:hypothetical protein